MMNPWLRRKLRKQQRQVESLGERAESLLERQFFKRLDRLVAVRRFVIGWLLFFILVCGCLVGQIRALDKHYRQLQPVSGGLYTEGIVGDFTNANPLYATGDVDTSVSRLLFAGLLTYDENNKLVGDLAESFAVDVTGKIYTVKLRPGLTWHDGAPLTSQDVVFTYQMIQNPDAQSSLHQGWKDIAVLAVDPMTVTFTLPNVLSSFPYYMTNGLIPQHVLKDVPPADLRASDFNTLRPVGAGPFAWQELEVSGETPESREELIALRPFDAYHAGKPKLASFVIHAFQNDGRLQESFARREVTAAMFEEVPAAVAGEDSVRLNNFMVSAANMVFFRQGMPLFSEPAVRKALVAGADTQSIIKDLDYPTRPVRSPLLLGQVAYDPSLTQPAYDPKAAAATLEAAGWKADASGQRSKAGKPLQFTLLAPDTPEIKQVTGKLQDDWKKLGASANIKLVGGDELQRAVTSHEYDALLYGISIGVDPDVFVYWHSSQNDPRSNRLNFAEYKAKAADEGLEAGRTRVDNGLRAVKYRPFLQAWQRDTPALGLYQPRILYVTHGTVYGLKEHTINQDTDRFNQVHTWQIRQAPVTNSPKSDLR